MSGHSRLSPSKRIRWASCPGSIREEDKYPDTGSGPAAVDGTHSHTLLEHCIKRGLSDPLAEVGESFTDHDGTFTVDTDRASRVGLAIDYIRERSMNGMFSVSSEQAVNPEFLLGRNDLDGTVDCVIIGDDFLEIIDYKDGMGVVTAVGNMQLEQYAYGVLAGYKLPINGDYPVSRIIMTIVQPKLALKSMPVITSHEVTVKSLMDNLGTIVAQAAATDNPDAPLVPGESQCKFCRAKGSCAALAGNVMAGVGVMFQQVASDVDDIAQQSADKDPSRMDDVQILQIMEAAPLMRQLLTAVEEEALRRLKTGIRIPGLKLVNGRGSRAWALPDAEIEEKLIKLGIPKSVIYESNLISPAKASKLTWQKRDGTKVSLTKPQIARIDQEYVTKLSGSLTVVPESDSRPAVITNAAPIFGAVSTEAINSPIDQPTVESLPSWLS